MNNQTSKVRRCSEIARRLADVSMWRNIPTENQSSTLAVRRTLFVFTTPTQTELILGSDPYRKCIIIGGNNGDWYFGWFSPLTTVNAFRWINQSSPLFVKWSDVGDMIGWSLYGFSNVPGVTAVVQTVSQRSEQQNPWGSNHASR